MEGNYVVKKQLCLIMVIAVLLSVRMTNVYATPMELVCDGNRYLYELAPITLYIDDMLVETQAMPPIQIEEITLVPVREIFEAIGAVIEWKEEEKKVYIAYQDTVIILEMNHPEAWVSGITFILDMPAKIINNKIMVPLRFISEQLGFDVYWDGVNRTIYINAPIEKVPEIEPEEESEDSADDTVVGVNQGNIRYENTTPKLLIDLKEEVIKEQLIIQNDYVNKKIIIDLGDNYETSFNNGSMMIQDTVIEYIEVKNTLTTQFVLHMNGIYEYELDEQAKKLEIKFIKPKDKYDKILFLDAGHGGKAPGSIANNLIEKEVNLKQTLAVKDLIENNTDIKVYLTRSEDISVSTEERPFIANDIGADLFVSIHNNSTSNSEVNGTEVHYYPDTNGDVNESIASLFQEKLIAYCGLKDRGVKPSPDLWVLKMSNMPAVLIEGGFLSNVSDASCLGDEAFTNAYAYAVYEAIVETFNHL